MEYVELFSFQAVLAYVSEHQDKILLILPRYNGNTTFWRIEIIQ